MKQRFDKIKIQILLMMKVIVVKKHLIELKKKN